MLMSILGGVLIGTAVSLMLFFNGRVTGISGIVGSVLQPGGEEKGWKAVFLLGLLIGGLFLKFTHPSAFILASESTTWDFIAGGFLVGFGTLLGNGCTSGHGVCGISRLSPRSIVATVTFILAGVISVILFRLLRGDL